MGLDPLTHRLHDLDVDAQQVVAAHARLPRDACGHDDDVCASDIGIVLGAGEAHVEAVNRRGFGQVQRLALRQPLDNVEDHNITKLLQRSQMRQRPTDIATTNQCDFLACHFADSFQAERRRRTGHRSSGKNVRTGAPDFADAKTRLPVSSACIPDDAGCRKAI